MNVVTGLLASALSIWAMSFFATDTQLTGADRILGYICACALMLLSARLVIRGMRDAAQHAHESPGE